MSARPSFLDRYKQMMLATPRDIDPTAKLVLLALFSFAHDDGSGIFVGTAALGDCTGLPRRTLFRCLKTLADRGYLADDGWKHHGPSIKTRLRRIDIAALQRDRHCHSATHGTGNGAGLSATGGTDHSATSGTQTKRDNQKITLRFAQRARSQQDEIFGQSEDDREELRAPLGASVLALMARLTGQPLPEARDTFGALLRTVAGAEGEDWPDPEWSDGGPALATMQLVAEAAMMRPPLADPAGWLFEAARARATPAH